MLLRKKTSTTVNSCYYRNDSTLDRARKYKAVRRSCTGARFMLLEQIKAHIQTNQVWGFNRIVD